MPLPVAPSGQSPQPQSQGGHGHGGGGGGGRGVAYDAIVEEQRRVQANLKLIKHKIVILSGKGGVGKSTVSTNLAWMLADQGYKVGILDMDLTGPDIPKVLGVEDARPEVGDGGIIPIQPHPNLKAMSIAFLLPSKDTAVIWRGPMKMHAIRQLLADTAWGDLDYLVIDLPPGTSDEPLSVAQNIPDADGCIAVTTPQDVAVLDVGKSISFLRQLNLPILGIVENMSGFVCPHCHHDVQLFGTGGGEKLANRLGVPFLGRIPMDEAVVRSSNEGRPFVANKTGHAAQAFIEVAQRALDILDANAKVRAEIPDSVKLLQERILKTPADRRIISLPMQAAPAAHGHASVTGGRLPRPANGKVTPEMNIRAIVETWPETVPILTRYGVGCVGCAVNKFENLGQGARTHGLDVSQIVTDLNAAIATVDRAG
jgi:hybrid cluster-associated redox disulfide protein